MGTYFFIWLFSLIYEVVRTNTLRRLEDSNRHLAEASAALRAEKQQTDDILAGVREGIFLLDGELRLGTSHSRYLETIFQGDQLAGRSLLELLKPLLPAQDYSSAADFFDLLLAGAVNPELLAEINPLSEIRCLFPAPDGQAHSKLLRFAFSRLGAVGAAGAAGAAGTAFSVLGVVVDASQEYELQQQLSVEERKHKQSMENLFRIIHVDPAMMREFIGDTEAELDQANELLKTEGTDREHIMVALGSSFHAIKGNALLLGLEEFAAKVHGYEDTVKELRSRGHSWRDLLSLTVGLGEIRGDLEELNGLITRIESFQALTVSRDGGAASLLQLSLDKFVQKESSRLGVPVSFDFRIAEGAAITEEHRKLVKDVLVQLVRNSFAHGFEHETTRLKLKKNPRCAISVQVDEQAGSLVLRYRDDGNGLDIGRIRAKAASLPLLAGRAAALSDQEVIKLIFMPGFSTARQTSLDAGRGEGMALVRNRVTAAGGRLGVKNKPGQYLEWTVTLPGMAVAEVSSA
ncbi:MAG TPA: hypothetical protein DCX65_03225 [Spirochaetaceae bacterium]|nr:hypothetical protein [Spirochaetaceae bacterium]